MSTPMKPLTSLGSGACSVKTTWRKYPPSRRLTSTAAVGLQPLSMVRCRAPSIVLIRCRKFKQSQAEGPVPLAKREDPGVVIDRRRLECRVGLSGDLECGHTREQWPESPSWRTARMSCEPPDKRGAGPGSCRWSGCARQTSAIWLQAAAKAASVASISVAGSGVGSSLQTMVRAVSMTPADCITEFCHRQEEGGREEPRLRGRSPCLKAIGIYTKFPRWKSFQGKALSSNSAQMNWVSHDNIIIFSDGYHAVFSGFFFG